MKKLIAISLLAGCSYAPLDVATGVSAEQLQGTWYEIGHLPRSTQDGCSNTTATYTLLDSSTLAVVHDCVLTSGSHLTSKAALYSIDKSTPAKMQLDLGGFLGDYWVLEMASDQRYLVVGHPSRDYFWILSRTTQLAKTDLDGILSRAQVKGFDTAKMRYTAQN